jgi:hypothetical protein
MNVFGPNFEQNTSNFFDSLLLIVWDKGGNIFSGVRKQCLAF